MSDTAATPADDNEPHVIHAEGEILTQKELAAALLSGHGSRPDSFELKSAKLTGEFVPESTAKPRHPAVRIVHRGGPARNATVYINGHEAETATRAEIVLDGNHEPGVYARIEFVGRPPIESANVQLDVAADEAEIVEAKPARFFWPVLLGLLLNAIPVGLAWWTWTLNGPLPDVVFALCVIGSIAWTLGVLVAFFGYSRVMAAAQRVDAEPECECEQ